MALFRITDEKLTDLLKVFFPHAEEMIEKEHKELGTDNIMMSPVEKKRLFMTHVTQRYLNFSHQRNNLVYNELLVLLGLEHRISLKPMEQRENKEKTRMHVFLQEFWQKLELFYSEFEAILNIYWRKGVDAEIKGMNREQVMGIIDHALYQNESGLRKAFYELLEKLNLADAQRKNIHRYHLPFNLIEYSPVKSVSVLSDPQKRMHDKLMLFRQQLEVTISYLNRVFLESFDEDLELRKEGADDSRLVEETESKIKEKWESIEEEFRKLGD